MSKTALITGSSAGLGRDLARLFAADGHDLVLVARREQRLRELADELSAAHGVQARVHACDLADPASPEALVGELEREGVEIEFLVNNAGFGSNGRFTELERARELGQVDLNIRALVDLTHRLLPPMVARGRGRVLNMGSTAGFQPGPYMSTYYATKAFVNHFSEGLAHELAGTGVSVTVCCPGPTATEFGAVSGNGKTALFKRLAVASSEDVARYAYGAMHAGRRMAVYGLSNKVSVGGTRFMPRGWLARIAGRLNQP